MDKIQHTGKKCIPARMHEWYKSRNADSGSLLFGKFKSVLDKATIPNPIQLRKYAENGKLDAVPEAQNPFPVLTVVENGWQQIEMDEHPQDNEKGFQLGILLMVYRLLLPDDSPVKDVAALQSDTLLPLIQRRNNRPPVDPDSPKDTTKWLWRPEDAQSFGISIHTLTAYEAPPISPLNFGQGIFVEQAAIKAVAEGIIRPIASV